LSVGDVQELNSARQYLSATNGIDVSQLTQIKQVQDFLEREKAQKTNALEGAATKRADLAQQNRTLLQTVADGRTKLDAMGAIPVMGDAILGAGQLAAWYRSTGDVARLAPGTTIDDLAQLYISEGAAEGVRGDLAFAQSMIETAGFSVAAGNNYSGIGVCDSCTGGFSFPTPRDGVRAQMQLLRSYADPDSRASNLASPPSPGIWGSDPTKAAHLYDTFFLKGKSPLWNQMGNGNWATDPTYAGKVVGLFNQMVVFANGHR
jgi:hypothetical protein